MGVSDVIVKTMILIEIWMEKTMIIKFQNGMRILMAILLEDRPVLLCQTDCLHFVFVLRLCDCDFISDRWINLVKEFQSNISFRYYIDIVTIFAVRIKSKEDKKMLKFFPKSHCKVWAKEHIVFEEISTIENVHYFLKSREKMYVEYLISRIN